MFVFQHSRPDASKCNRCLTILGLCLVALAGVVHDQVYSAAPMPAAGIDGNVAFRTSSHQPTPKRDTDHPAGRAPDQIIMLPGDDAITSFRIRWRTGVHSEPAQVVVQSADQSQPAVTFAARTIQVDTAEVANDPIIFHHEAHITGLEPGHRYAVSVGSRGGETSPPKTFTTAAVTQDHVRFVYIGDAQKGFDAWGTLVREADRRFPDAAFWMFAGDLVHKGNTRSEWDDLFYEAGDIFTRRILIPAPGNHEDAYDALLDDRHPSMYLQWFNLPENGPRDVEPERVYQWRYGLVHIFVLDSQLDPEKLAPWLDRELAASDAAWKIPMFHIPFYAARDRNDPWRKWRKPLAPLLEKHGVKLVLQGHDHSYMRTYPMLDEKIRAQPEDGITYVVSYSGTRDHPIGKHDYAARVGDHDRTYQIIDATPAKLHYRAFDEHHKLFDELTIYADPANRPGEVSRDAGPKITE